MNAKIAKWQINHQVIAIRQVTLNFLLPCTVKITFLRIRREECLPSPLLSKILNDLRPLLNTGNDYSACISHQSLMDHLSLRPQFHRSLMSLENVITSLLINPEPLVLSTFPSEEGWAVPKFHGSCGRVIIEDDAGEPLSSHLFKEFEARARFSIQLLQIAEDFTSRHQDLSLYLTDWTLDNFAVDIRNKVR